MDDETSLRNTFDQDALLYDRARPGYPDALFEDITAFHWIDPAIGYRKLAQALKPEGAIALFWNKPVQTKLSASLVQPMQDIYKQIVPALAKNFPGLVPPDQVPTPVKDENDRGFLTT